MQSIVRGESPAMLRQLLWNACHKYNLPYDILCAIVGVESNWDPWSVRFEKGFGYLVSPAKFARTLGISVETEEILQKCSWGLAQIMGGAARELGYTERLNMLCIPELNVEMMCEFFNKHCAKYPLMEEKIASYNAGTPKLLANGKYANQDYVDLVKKKTIEERGVFVQ